MMTTLIFNIALFMISQSDQESLLAQKRQELVSIASLLAGELQNLEFEALQTDDPKRWGWFSGEIFRYSDYRLIQELVERSNGAIQQKAKLNESLLSEIESELKALVKNQGFDLQINRRGRQFIVQQASSSLLSQLRQIYPEVHGAIQKKKRASTVKPTVFLEVAFVEVKKEALRSLGLRFGDPISFGTSIQPSLIQTPAKLIGISGFNPIGSFLDLALQKNLARVHFKQSLVSEDGGRAEFRVGGEYSFRNNSRESSSVVKIPYGIEIKFTAKLVENKKIHLVIHSLIREPDLASNVGDFPEIREKVLDTQLFTTLDETMAIAGILRTSQGRAIRKVPGLGELPILGRLFTSKDFRSNKSEAYIFITPRRISSEWKPEFKEGWY